MTYKGLTQLYIDIFEIKMKKVEENEGSLENDSCSIESPTKETPVLKQQPLKKKIKKKKNINGDLIANLAQTKYTVVKKVLKGVLGFKIIRDASNDDWDVYWTDNAVTPEQLGKMKQYQKINHFPGMFTLSRKNYLARNLSKMQKMFPQDYNFFPKTWVLPSQLNQLRKYMESDNNPVVIAKPEASCQGKGIFLTKSIEDFDYGEHYVVQKYMKRPFIIDGLKFDFRIYVLVAGCDPLRVYIYNEGLTRFATDPYSPPKKDNLKNLFMHLTNYAINKNSDKFQFNNSKNEMDKGHKRSLSAVLKKIEELGHNREELWERIKDCIAKTLISAQPLLAHHYRSCQPQNYANNMCFEILGFDVLLDHALKPEILEVNYTPSFSTDTPLDLQIKKNLITESMILMNLTQKAKNEVISQKKKEMQERTLTGKKFYHSKQSRLELIAKLQNNRDKFQMSHLGNFERILPLCEKEQTKRGKYDEFLQFSEQCYLETTGAHVRRNNKVTPTTKTNIPSQSSQLQLLEQNQQNTQKGPPTQQQIYNQPAKYTNTENLQKIYKTKFKPMVYRKVGKSQNANASKIVKKESEVSNSSGKFISSKSVKNKQALDDIGLENSNKIQKNSTKTITYTKQTIQRVEKLEKNQKLLDKFECVNKECVKGFKGVRAMNSMKKGLSTVYNITFQEKCQISQGFRKE